MQELMYTLRLAGRAQLSVKGGSRGKTLKNMGVPGACPRKSLEILKNLHLKGGGGGQARSDPPPPLHAPD